MHLLKQKKLAPGNQNLKYSNHYKFSKVVQNISIGTGFAFLISGQCINYVAIRSWADLMKDTKSCRYCMTNSIVTVN